MRDRPPAFQFYPRDFLTDPSVMLMTPEERGGYVHLLCHAWLASDPGILPCDDHILAVLSGLGEDRWKVCREGIGKAFIQRDDRWVQKRLSQERKTQQERSEKMRRLAKSKARNGPVAAPNGSGPAGSTQSSASASAVTPESKTTHPPLLEAPTAAAVVPAPNGNGGATQPQAPVGGWGASAGDQPQPPETDAVHRLVAAGVDSIEADQLLEKQRQARERIGLPGGLP